MPVTRQEQSVELAQSDWPKWLSGTSAQRVKHLTAPAKRRFERVHSTCRRSVADQTVMLEAGISFETYRRWYKIWRGDPLTGVGAGSGMILAVIVGGLAALFYVVDLKIFDRSDTADKNM